MYSSRKQPLASHGVGPWGKIKSLNVPCDVQIAKQLEQADISGRRSKRGEQKVTISPPGRRKNVQYRLTAVELNHIPS